MLYRYTIMFNGELKGLLVLAEDLGIHNEYTTQAQVLTLGELPLPKGKDVTNTISYFTEKGYRKFREDMDLMLYGVIKELGTSMGITPTKIEVDERFVESEIVYQDEYQIIYKNYNIDRTTHTIYPYVVTYADIQYKIKSDEEVQDLYADRVLGGGKALKFAKEITTIFNKHGITKNNWSACHAILQLFTTEFENRQDLKLVDKLEAVRSELEQYLLSEKYTESLDMQIPYIWYVYNKKNLVAITPNLEKSVKGLKTTDEFKGVTDNVLLSFLYKVTMDYKESKVNGNSIFKTIKNNMNGTKDATDLLVPLIKKSKYTQITSTN